MGVSRATAYKWVRRFAAEGAAGLEDRSSRPHGQPRRTPARVEQRVQALRRQRKLGPARIGAIVGLPASTVHRILVRQGLQRLAWLDRPTGLVIRRYERDRPGELVHVDTKKLGRIPDGGGWRTLGRQRGDHRRDRRRGPGYEYVHSVVDDHSRLAYSEIHDDETSATCAAVLRRALGFYAAHGVRIERVLTDNAEAYRRGSAWQLVLDEHGLGHRLIRPYRPQTNGKVERFHRTLLDEWAYAQPFTSNQQRRAALHDWLHRYNYHRAPHRHRRPTSRQPRQQRL
jgi:transposase InsO family protein